MKRLSTLLLAMVVTAASAAIYPSSDWFGTNVQKQTTAAGVRAALGITSTGGSATNVYFTSGQSTTPRTVSGSNTFDVTGTLTNYTRNYSAGISNNAADSVNVVFQSANRLVFNDPTGGEQAHYVWGRAGTSLGSQDSFWWNPDLNFSWLSFFSHPFMGVGFNDDRVLIEWNYDESNVITNHIYGTNTSITIDGRYRGAGLSLTSTETNSSLTGGVLAADANGKRKIATLSGLSWDGSSLTVNSGGPLVGDGSGLSNVVNASIPTFNSISNMIAASVTNNEVIVNSYWGTNHSPGRFRLFTGTMTTNLGTIFTNGVSGGYRVRVEWLQRTNELKLEWFGTWPNQYDVTSGLRDQSDRVQAAIDATPGDQGVLIIPEYWITITNSLVFTNWRGAYFGGATAATRSPGYRYWPYPVSGFNWNGPTNLAMIKQHNVGHTTFAHFGLDTRPPAQAAYWSNYATLMIDADQLTGHITTTSANRYSGMMFRERGTNAGLVGVRIANTSYDNCEFFHFEDCYFAGSGASDRSQYWMATTNIGAATAIQVGGNGGGANSFSHTLTRCGFDSWQYFVNGNGNWYVQNCYGTAAGVRGYHFTGNAASYLIGVNDEGDRQFAYSTGPLYLESCRIALVSLSVSNIAAVDGPQITMNNCIYNNDPSGNTPSVTNSYNATGRYSGRNNTLASVNNDALSISSWRFSSAFNSLGDFGTIAANNNIQSFPMKTPSALSLTNKVWADYLDSATWPYLTLMPSNGSLAVGSPGGNAVLSVFNTDPAVKYHYSFGDAVKTIRHRGYAGGATTYAEVNGLSQGWQIIQSTNAVFNLKAGNANSTINFQSGYGSITTTGDVAVVRFENDGRVRFPNNTNVEFVGPIHGGVLRATNHLTLFTNDTLASLGATPTRYGQISLVDSNATLLAATATTSGSLAWGSTNVIPTTSAQVVNKFTGTPTGSLFLRDDGTLAAPSVGGVAWGAISGTLSSQTDLQTALDAKAALAEANQFTKTNAFDAIRVTNLLQGASTAIVGWNAASKLLTTQSVSVAGSQITLGGTDGKLLYNNSGGIDYAEWANVQALTSNAIITNNHSADVTFAGKITGNGSGITNLQFAPTAISLGGTNAAMLSNMVSTLVVSTNVLFTNWPAMAVAGYWGRTILTNSQPNNELIYVPTNMMPHNLTNSVGCYIVLDNTGTNWACTLTNLRTAELVWSAWGGNVNSMHAYFRHW